LFFRSKLDKEGDLMKIELFDEQGNKIDWDKGSVQPLAESVDRDLLRTVATMELPDFGCIWAGVIKPAEKIFLLQAVNCGARPLSAASVCVWEIQLNGQTAAEFRQAIQARLVRFLEDNLERHQKLSRKFATALAEMKPERNTLLWL